MNKINDEFNNGSQRFRESKFYQDHGRVVNQHLNGFYRSRNGKLLGVCAGIANKLNISVTLVRFLTIFFTFFTGFFFGLFLYVVLALFMDLEPENNYKYSEYSSDYKLRSILERSERLAKRIENIENAVTKDHKSWEERLYNQ